MRRTRRKSDQPAASLDDLLEPSAEEPSSADPSVAEQADLTEQAGSVADGDFLDDPDFLPQERRQLSRLTVALVGVLILVFGVLGGIWIQKQFGGQSSAAAAGFPAAGQGSRAGEGFPGGGQRLPSGQGLPGGGGYGQPGQAPSAGGAVGSSETPVVVGTVTKLKTDQLVVKDLGGKSHQVTVAKAATVTLPFQHGKLQVGDLVSITGSETPQQVTATAITVR